WAGDIANCEANPTFQPVASGGDGDDVQFWYVGVDPTLKTVVVAHQGTDPEKLMPLITDADFFLGKLDSNLFPGINRKLEVHDGFRDAHAETAPDVLTAVKTALSQSGFNDVTVVGHSLGAAIALLDGVYLPLHLPGVNVKTIGYGMPRVVSWDSTTPQAKSTFKLTNLGSLAPVRILDWGWWRADMCRFLGQDNSDSRCSVGDVKSIFSGSLEDHSGKSTPWGVSNYDA
ncbi:hypothetical protein C0991_011323, partial [Blastosporella zonata]